MIAREIPVYILAGGKSSRFGSDKARALFRGEPLLRRIVKELEPRAASFTAVADVAEKYSDLGVRTVVDEYAAKGPMGGMHAALKDFGMPGWVLVVSCDFVSLKLAWVESLWAARDESDLKAIAFRAERIEPLLALYHSSLLVEIEARIERGELSPAKLIEETRARILALPADWPARAHVNSTDELIEAGS